MNLSLGIIFGLIAMFGWGTGDFLAAVACKRTNNYKLLFWSQLLGVVVIFVYLIFSNQLQTPDKALLGLVIAGVTSLVAYTAFYRGLTVGKASIVSPVASPWAAVAVVLSVIFLKDHITNLQIVAVALTMVGVFLVSADIKEFIKIRGKSFALGVRDAVIALFGWGIMATALGYSSRQIGWVMPTFAMKVIVVSLLAIYMKSKKENFKVAKDYKLFILIAFVGLLDVVAFFALNAGLIAGSSAVVVPFAGAFTLVSVILAHIFFREKLVPNQYIGIVGVLAGLILLAVK